MSRADQSAATIERMLAIRALPLFSDVHLDELAIIAEHARQVACAGGDTLPPGIHLVIAGSVIEHRGGRPFRTHGPQHVVGGIDALALGDTDTRLVAEDETSTLTIARTDLRDILEDNFGVLSATLQGVAASTLRLRRQLPPSAGFPRHAGKRRPASLPVDDLGPRTVFLRAHGSLPQARIETLGHLAREATLDSLADQGALWQEGEPADYALVVVSGDVTCTSLPGRHRFERGPGAVVGLDEALAIETRWYAAEARGPLSFLRVTRDAIIDALEDDPDTALHLLTTLARIASRLRDRVARTTMRSA